MGVYNSNNITKWTVKLKSNIMALNRELVKGEKLHISSLFVFRKVKTWSASISFGSFQVRITNHLSTYLEIIEVIVFVINRAYDSCCWLSSRMYNSQLLLIDSIPYSKSCLNRNLNITFLLSDYKPSRILIRKAILGVSLFILCRIW